MRRLDDLYEKSNISRGGDYLAGPLNSFLCIREYGDIWKPKAPYRILKETPKSFKEVSSLTAFSEQEVLDESEKTPNQVELNSKILLPPNNLFTDAVPESSEDLVSQIDEMVNNNLVQQFYEAYLAPTGLKDVYNRLGTISGTIADIHFIFPFGKKGVIAADNTASWRTGINYTFQVDTGLVGAKPETYNSLAFPPFINHSEVLDFQTFETLETKEDTPSPFQGQDFFSLNADDRSFDLTNLLYRRGRATYRFPAFKQINDNIHLLQNFLTKCFGIENTYINEWDLSMYIQEGLLQILEKEDTSHNLVSVPQYVTTLTYGLLSDSPIKGLYYDLKDLDIASAETYASVNMAVSTRLGVDNTPLSTSANEQVYEISKYPYSAYWSPDEDGNILKEPVKYTETTYDDEGNLETKIKYETWNVSKYIIDILGYEDNGLVFANETTEEPTNRGYTFKIFRGEDLASSKKTLLDLILYTDARNAILTGWNGTDDKGQKVLKDSDGVNGNEKLSNAYSYLPFWKQFYTSPEDGMSDIDKYMQEVTATGDHISWLTVASNLIDIMTSENTSFQNLCESKRNETGSLNNVQSGKASKAFYINDNSAAGTSDFTDYSFKIFKFKISIPNSKLLKMFAKKDSQAKKAQQMANKKSDFSAPGGGPANSATKSQPKVSKPEKVVDEDGNDISTQVVEDPDALNTKQVEGVGIAEHSPFIYGGPHGMYYDPNTLEGYCQAGNRNLASVPTVDVVSLFKGSVPGNQTSPTGFTKNFKEAGSYADIVTVLTPNERYALLNGSTKLGVKGLGPNNLFNVPYTSNIFKRFYFDDYKDYYTLKFFSHKVKVPKLWLWRLSKWDTQKSSVNFNKWYNYSYSLETREFKERLKTTKRIAVLPFEKDWVDTDFCLYPVTETNLSLVQSSTSETIWNLIKEDENKYFQTRDLFTNLPDVRNKGITDSKICYLICPAQEEPNTVNYETFTVSSYSNTKSEWNSQCDHLWYTGAREFTATLPIRSPEGKVLVYVCGVVKVVESTVQVWEYNLKPEVKTTKHRFLWNTHTDYSKSWTWTLELKSKKVHNCYFMPNKILWSLPTKELIDQSKVFNDSTQDRSSSDIVARHKSDDTTATESFKNPSLLVDEQSINNIKNAMFTIPKEVFPFSQDFMLKFGVVPADTNPIPGTRQSKETYGGLRLPRSKGFYFGDFSENFRQNNGEIKSVTEVDTGFEVYQEPFYYTETLEASKGGGLFGFLAFLAGSLFGVRKLDPKSTILDWTADFATNKVTDSETLEEHTKTFRSIQCLDSILANRSGTTQRLTWYRTQEAMEVYIEIAKKQIRWLQELQSYAQLYFKDYLLVELFNNSIDPIVKKAVTNEKQGLSYSINDSKIGFTDSWTEDLYYEEPLRMLLETYALPDASVEGVEQDSITDQNTLFDLIETRLTQIRALLKKAETLKDYYEKGWSSLEDEEEPNDEDLKFARKSKAYENFVVLVSDTWAILQQAKTGPDLAVDLVRGGTYIGGEVPFPITNETTFDLVSNPGVALWSYLNLLYQVRKFWIKCRFNKQNGSYWFLRGLERVLVFMKANQMGITNPGNAVNEYPKNSDTYNEKASEILYVQSRVSILDQAPVFQVDTNPSETGAVYIKVNYLNISDIKNHPDYKKIGSVETFKGRAIQYVDEVYKYCYLPIKGPYYILSESLISKINSNSAQMTKVLGDIYSKKYILTQSDVDSYFKPKGDVIKAELRLSVSRRLEKDEMTGNLDDLVELEYSKTPYGRQGAVLEVGKSLEESFKDNVRNQDLADVFTELVQTLLEAKQETYSNLIQACLKKLYIKWNWQEVSTSLSPTDDGIGYIDKVQAAETKDKTRTIIDLYGYEHKATGELKAGITFNVAASLNPNLLLGSTDRLKKATVLETMCATLNTMDLWRIQIPEGLSINMEDIKDSPILVPAYAIEGDLAPFLSQEIKPTSRTVLAGAPTNAIVPVEEASEGILTVNTLAALGKIDTLEIPNDSLFKEETE